MYRLFFSVIYCIEKVHLIRCEKYSKHSWICYSKVSFKIPYLHWVSHTWWSASDFIASQQPIFEVILFCGANNLSFSFTSVEIQHSNNEFASDISISCDSVKNWNWNVPFGKSITWLDFLRLSWIWKMSYPRTTIEIIQFSSGMFGKLKCMISKASPHVIIIFACFHTYQQSFSVCDQRCKPISEEW